MAGQWLVDDFGKLLLYEQEFSSSCPLGTRDFHRLRNSLYITLSSSSDSDYSDGGESGLSDDVHFQGNPPVSFSITERKRLKISVGNLSRVIPNVSFLPMNDRVLHYCLQMDLGYMEEKIIKEFTVFLGSHHVELSGPFACLQNVMPPVNSLNVQCKLIADRPIPLYTAYMPETWNADEIGVINGERDDGKRLYHFTAHGLMDRRNIEDNFIYSGGDFDTAEPERRIGEVVDGAQLVKEAFIMKCVCVEWLKLLNAVAPHTYVTPHVKCMEDIIEMWKACNWDEGSEENKGEKVRTGLEMRRRYTDLKRIRHRDSKYNEGLYKAKAGLKYAVRLQADLSLSLKQKGRSGTSIEEGCIDSLGYAAYLLGCEYETGPAFDIEVWIRFGYGYTTAKRVEQAAKRAKTLHDMSRMLGLDNVYELGPYLQCMNWGRYVAGGCFVFRKNMVPGRDIEDFKAWHFKVKDLMGYIYSNKLSRKCLESYAVEAVTEGESVYYRELPRDQKHDEYEPRLGLHCLEKYVGGAGFDPSQIGDAQDVQEKEGNVV